MATGRVLQFDHARGYGFVAADDGGEDVFLHASVFDGDTDELHPGAQVEFKIMEGDRGRKAFAAHLGAGERGQEDAPFSPQQVPSAPPVPALPTVQPLPVTVSREPDEKRAQDDERMCDVLSQAEFEQELTELLLDNVPALTGQQILMVRRSVLELAGKHGWVDI